MEGTGFEGSVDCGSSVGVEFGGEAPEIGARGGGEVEWEGWMGGDD